MSLCVHSFTERNSKHLDELLASAPKFPTDNKLGENDILRVVEMYCAGGRSGAIIRTLGSMCS